ncbi:MAG: hypothetical protein R3175_08560 [Marinobacter sp.]|uniref:COG3014 family protein n=1 Tax=Marinobacter sp. TaxID=50741 RepID=UPI00299D54F4|nr:hypothetical protein [Marinobacter sp.]MDX1756094.1 hypothetical protein [Marinobacter sp.]
MSLRAYRGLPVRWLRWTVLWAVLMTDGCASLQQRNQQARFNAAYLVGDYAAAANAMALSGQDVGTPVLELLHQGGAYWLTGDYQGAIAVFDQAEAGMKHLDTEGVVAGLGQDLMSLLVNESSRDYRALMSEAILVNTFKALAFLAQANTDYARVEFNRADDRTRRAVDFFADDIRRQRDSIRESAADAGDVRRSLNSDDLRSAVAQNYGDPSIWGVYPDYMVPVSTYLHGLYFLANGTGPTERERALDSLSRVAQMMPDNPVLKTDVRLAERQASGQLRRRSLPPQVWVVYENGLGPVPEEVRFEVPLFVSGDHGSQLIITAIALPRYRDRLALPGALQLEGDAVVIAEPLAEMGRVIRTEMQARFPGILMRALASAVVKGVMQRQAADSMGALGQFGAMLYTVSTTQADLRSWQTLPDHWAVARLARPESGQLRVSDTLTGQLGEISLPNWPFTLVYVKRPTAQAPATVIVLDLQGRHAAVNYRLPNADDQAALAEAQDGTAGPGSSQME